MKSICLLNYSAPHVEAQHLQCVQAVMESGFADINQFFCGPPIDAVRSIQATEHMHSHDVLLFIDHDSIFTVDDVRLVTQTAFEEQAVVGAAYSGRAPMAPIIGKPAKTPVTFFDGGSLVPATRLGCGFMAIPSPVLELMVRQHDMDLLEVSAGKQCYPFFASELTASHWYGEDISFCRRVLEQGSRLLLDTRIRIGHKGSYVYQIEDCFAKVAQLKTLITP